MAVAVLNMAAALVDLADERFRAGQPTLAVATLDGLLRRTGLSPAVAADAWHLRALHSFELGDFAAAYEHACQGLAAVPNHGDLHFLAAQALESQTDDVPPGQDAAALDHYAKAAKYAPDDAEKVGVYGLRLTLAGKASAGLGRLWRSYRLDESDPASLERLLEGLHAAGRIDDAELLLAQAWRRFADDRRFGEIRSEWRLRLRAAKAVRPEISEALEPRSTIPFVTLDAAERAAATIRATRPAAESAAVRVAASARFSREETLAEVLRKSTVELVAAVHEQLGLPEGRSAAAMRKDLAAVLTRPTELRNLVRSLPESSRRLLRTLVRAGGYVPAGTLFQTTRRQLSAAEVVQPLLSHGLLYFGKPAQPSAAVGPGYVALVPCDVCKALSAALRLRLKDSPA
ncbi:MAG: hypothetical protein ACRDD1_12775 [Planctomycetia bacterium]